MKPKDRVCIGMINDGTIDSALVLDLIQIAKVKDSGFDSFIQVQGKGQITRNRNKVVQEFLKQTTAEWLLFIDSDERLPAEAWLRLTGAASEKHKVVSALVFANFDDINGNPRPVPTIYVNSPTGTFNCIDGYPLDSLIEVDGMGGGCFIIHRSVLLEIQKHASENQGKDWCWFIEGAINGTYFGEDLLFCKRLQQLGIKIYAHTGAILAHHKDFWLDDRHHTHIREEALRLSQAKSESEESPTSDSPLTN